MVRIHADGSGDPSLHGVSTLVPALHRGWTDDIYAPSVRAGRALQRAVVSATGAADRGLVQRADLTGFNWSNVPSVLVEAGFLSNPAERRLLQTGAYQQRAARGLTVGVAALIALPSARS
jgi:N-acetylmuramoyl-L-alanine amidase